jgi:hypothetical protein
METGLAGWGGRNRTPAFRISMYLKCGADFGGPRHVLRSRDFRARAASNGIASGNYCRTQQHPMNQLHPNFAIRLSRKDWLFARNRASLLRPR